MYFSILRPHRRGLRVALNPVPDGLLTAVADRYRVEGEIGAGGMATVYLASDLRHNRKVAIKVLRPEYTEALGGERFLREIETTANLRHAHIVPLYDSGEAGGFLFYVMPLVEGETLRDRLIREKQLPIEEALTIGREVADALAYAHARGLVHRDIKPENILLENGHAVVADFGIARAVTAAGTDLLTQTGTAVGTLLYMSPEQASGERDIDGRSDLYSLGCVVYEMLAGQPPFTGATAAAITSQHLVAEPPPVTHLRPTVSPDVAHALATTLAKSPADRFASAAQLAESLSLSPSSTGQTGVRGRRPSRARAFAAAIVVGVLAVSGLAFALFGPERSDFAAGGSRLDADVVAVMPFRVSVPEELSYLGGGFMDLLAARLDGEVGPRAVDPGAVVAAASRGSGEPRRVAEGLGAGLVLTGSIVGGTSGIVVSAETSDVSDGSLRASASAQGHPDSISALADRLVIELLSLGAGEYTTSIASLTSTSPDALRAYLRGKQAFRDGVYFEGISHFDEALALDSTFALAAIARQDGATNTIVGSGGNGLERAWRHRHRLGPRDLMYLEARRPPQPRTGAENIAVFERLTREQPDRVEAWYWLGEYLFHARGLMKDQSWADQTRAVFEKTLEVDPDYIPAVDHLIFLEPKFGTPEQLRHIAVKLYQRPDSTRASPVMQGLARGEAELTLEVDALAGLDAANLALAPWWPLYAPDHVPADFLAYVEAAFAENRRRAGIDIGLERVLLTEFLVNHALGRPERAAAVREERVRQGFIPRYDRNAIWDALWAGIALEDAAVAVQSIDERIEGARGTGLSMEDARDITAAEVWRYRQDPTHSGAGAAALIRTAAEQAAHPQDLELEAMALLVESWDQVRRDDPRARGSLDRLVAIVAVDPGGGMIGRLDIGFPQGLLALSALHEELGDARGALESLDRVPLTSVQEYQGTIYREQGRLAALTGDSGRAIREYRRWLTLHSGAEASVLPEVERVRAEVARLERLR